MNLETYFYIFPNCVPRRICDDIINYGLQQSEEVGITGMFRGKNLDDNELKKLHKMRDSSVVWMNDKWIWRSIESAVHIANKEAGWNFDISQPESFQFTKYKKKQHYDWHQDDFPRPDENGLMRKISMTVTLADGDEYEGGDFQLDLRNTSDGSPNIHTCHEARKKGSIIVFPSFIYHRVLPVTKGTRYSLVVWNKGAPFR